MIIDLTGRRAVVTGSTAGIDRATVEGVARADLAVVVNGRGQERIDATVAELKALFPNGDVAGVAADLPTAEGAQRLIDAAPDADILVNSMGTAFLRDYAGFADVVKVPDEEWLQLLQINVMSGLRIIRHYLSRMVERGWGRVVFVFTESAVNILKGMVDYGVTKIAQLGVSRGLAEAVAGTSVTVNAVLPGSSRTEIMGNAMAGVAEAQGNWQLEAEQAFLKNARPTSLLGRFATPEEVANMIVYVYSNQAAATSAASLRVDGGVVRFAA